MKRSRVGLLCLAACAACFVGSAAAAFFSGCGAIQSAAGAMASATAGTPAGSVFKGIELSAESFKGFSPSQEHYIGRSVAVEILSKYTVDPDKAIQEYVNLVGQAVLIAPEAGKTFAGYHFVVVEGDELQAVSTPGGFVFLTRGTVNRAKDEDELASVLAHEIAHVTLKHGMKSIKAATRKAAAAQLVKGIGEVGVAAAGSDSKDLVELTSAFGNTISDITGDLLVKGYSRETEVEADKLAVTLMKSSGYARAALASYLKRVGEEHSGGEGGWSSTHPKPADRIAQLGDVGTGAALGRDVRKRRFAQVVGG